MSEADSGPEVKRLSGERLHALLAAPFARLKLPPPSLEKCRDLARFAGSGPFDRGTRPSHTEISRQAAAAMKAASKALAEIEAYHAAVVENAKLTVPDWAHGIEEASLAPVKALRKTLALCEERGLLDQTDKPVRAGSAWHRAAERLGVLFFQIVGETAPGSRVGLGEPSLSFIQAGLIDLGWGRHDIEAIRKAIEVRELMRAVADDGPLA